jgi:protein phosphatase PTC7
LQSRAHCNLAQELSLDNEIDSPFAILAKDNDICWGGGRPDDITVIVSRVIDPTEEGPHGQNAALAAPQLGSSCASSSWHA